MDGSSMGGFMAVFAVSGSVVLVAHQFHKRLLSDFMKKIEFELGTKKGQSKKRVRFADGVEVMPLPQEKADYRREDFSGKNLAVDGGRKCEKETLQMPLNRQILYKGMIKDRALKVKAKGPISNKLVI